MGIRELLRHPLQHPTDPRYVGIEFQVIKILVNDYAYSELRPLPVLMMCKRLRRCKVHK